MDIKYKWDLAYQNSWVGWVTKWLIKFFSSFIFGNTNNNVL